MANKGEDISEVKKTLAIMFIVVVVALTILYFVGAIDNSPEQAKYAAEARCVVKGNYNGVEDIAHENNVFAFKCKENGTRLIEIDNIIFVEVG